jgi:hypothetical protein
MHLLVFLFILLLLTAIPVFVFLERGVGLENSCIAETYMGRFGKMP